MTNPPNTRPDPFFIGDHLAMDFLNTFADGGAEWLANGADLVDWLERAGAIDRAAASRFRADGDRKRLDAAATRARALRDWLRGFLRKQASGRAGSKFLADLAPLNELLAEDDSYAKILARVDDGHGHPDIARISRWTGPDQLLQPIAAAIADLICNEDLQLIRSCEGPNCTLMFLDRTKSHARRWCSMAACGNRAKAAAHRARTRKPAGRRAMTPKE